MEGGGGGKACRSLSLGLLSMNQSNLTQFVVIEIICSLLSFTAITPTQGKIDWFNNRVFHNILDYRKYCDEY